MSHEPSMPHLRIGELAHELGLNPKTIRYYEEIGLLPVPARSSTGYRLYGAADRERLRFIVTAKSLGLTLQEIGEILSLRDAGQEPRQHVQNVIERKLATIDEQLQRLTGLRDDLLRLHAKTTEVEGLSTPIFDIIESHVSLRPTDYREPLTRRYRPLAHKERPQPKSRAAASD